MNRLCVYCGSSSGLTSNYADAAAAFARHLVASNIGVVYGGAANGIMGVLADTVLDAGGTVHGVIPQVLVDKEIAHRGLTELHIVNSMHERKSLMADLSDGFVALPGGYGTLEEIVEILTWGQLQFHSKPCGLLNVNGYFDDLLKFLDRARDEGFLRSEHRRMLLVANTPAELLLMFGDYEPPVGKKWRDEKG